MYLLTDDLLGAYEDGFTVVDSTIPKGQPGHLFRCKCILLYFTGDYPALAKASGTHDKCCHWCEYKSEPSPETNRRR